jgi:hypothetical protein
VGKESDLPPVHCQFEAGALEGSHRPPPPCGFPSVVRDFPLKLQFNGVMCLNIVQRDAHCIEECFPEALLTLCCELEPVCHLSLMPGAPYTSPMHWIRTAYVRQSTSLTMRNIFSWCDMPLSLVWYSLWVWILWFQSHNYWHRILLNFLVFYWKALSYFNQTNWNLYELSALIFKKEKCDWRRVKVSNCQVSFRNFKRLASKFFFPWHILLYL